MNSEYYNVLGVMSGTSLDGVDLAHIKLSFKHNKWKYSIAEAATVPYSKEWVQKLKEAVDYKPQELEELNRDYTVLLSETINQFVAINHIKNLDAVCSHGHTVLHQPHDGITLQIGNRPEVAALTQQTVICDFRVQDVLLGGQGAPLVPIGDRLLFSKYDYCLNLGGFSNISFDEGGRRIAYDICPVNTVLNYYANKLGMAYDDGGTAASGGKVVSRLLNQLNNLQFYNLPYPKSLGFEFVKSVVIPLIESYDIDIQDKLCTFIEHIAVQIAKVLCEEDKKTLLITGGGTYNTFLINRLKAYAKDIYITIPDNDTIQYKEALIFALLGVLRLRNEINVLSSVTGAARDHSSGQVYVP